MNIWLYRDTLKLLKEKTIPEIDALYRYDRDPDFLQVDVATFKDDVLKEVRKALEETNTRKAKIALNTLKAWTDAKACPQNQIPKRLEQASDLLKLYIQTSPGYRIYRQVTDSIIKAYVVTNIQYSPGDRYSEAHVKIEARSYKFGSVIKNTFTFSRGDVIGKTCARILADEGLSLENTELRERYLKDVEKYKTISTQIGEKYLASGYGDTTNREWSHDRVPLLVDGRRSVVIIDEEEGRDGNVEKSKKECPLVSCDFWGKLKNEEVDEDEEDTKEIFLEVPLDPKLYIFHLTRHEQMIVHVSFLEKYRYNKNLGEMLVLPRDNRDLIDVLIEHTNSEFKDIVAGKSGGSIILCTGAPGTGKTLTAEVYAEIMERPLYCVQSSQLGISAESLEKELQLVLKRASRWGAILLIDEADVFIHDRGADINQNAVVGVFLRVLEYYSGVLFLTTNRETFIDDAIASRATAKITYQVPSIEDQKRIWKILSTNSNIKVSDEVIEEISKTHPELSGRDVKNLLKLSSLISKKRKEPISVETIEFVMRFKQTTTKKES